MCHLQRSSSSTPSDLENASKFQTLTKSVASDFIKFHNLRKKRVFYINESLEKELGEEYFFDGTYVLKNGEVLKQCSTWEKMVIENIYKEALNYFNKVHFIKDK